MELLSVTSFQYEEHSGQVNFQTKLPEGSKQYHFYLINRDVPQYVPPARIELPYTKLENQLVSVDFNLDEILKSTDISNDSSWYLVLQSDSTQYECRLESGNFKYFFLNNTNLYKVKPYLTKRNTIAFYIRYIEVSNQTQNLQYDMGMLKGEMQVTAENVDYSSVKLTLGVQERGSKNIQEFDCISLPIEKERNLEFELPLSNELNGFRGNELVFDILIILRGRNCYLEQKINLDKNKTSQFDYYNSELNEFYSIKPYENKEGFLSLYAKKKNILPLLSDINFEKTTGLLSIEGILSIMENEDVINNYEAISCVFKQRNPLGKTKNYFVEEEIPLDLTGKIFMGSLLLNKYFPIEKAFVGNVWDVFVRIQGKNGNFEDYLVTMVETYKDKNFEYYTFDAESASKKIKPYITASKGLSLFIADSFKKDTTKIAILGSCYSRGPFNSSQFFNPNYKNLYEVVFTQFHSSLISLVSEPVQFTQEDLGNLEERFISFFTRDFKKTFFEDLKNASPDYLILDLDLDATHNLVKVSESQIVTLTYMLAKTNFIKNNQDHLKYILHDNDEAYLELWKKAADIFIAKLIEIIPPERIILTSGRYAEKYLDSKKEIKTFPNLKYIKERNSLWEQLDYYFISKLPQAKVINLTKTNFIGDELYPFGDKAAPPHYQSGYYKEFLRQLNEIVLVSKNTEQKQEMFVLS